MGLGGGLGRGTLPTWEGTRGNHDKEFAPGPLTVVVDGCYATQHMAHTRSNTTIPDPTNPKPEDLVGCAVRTLRVAHELGVRELSRASGVAAPQISRLERGQVQKPAVENLIALSRVFQRNPVPLLVMARYIDGEDARARLRAFFAEGIEFEEEWIAWQGQDSLREVRASLADPSTSEDDLRLLAFNVFMAGETNETLWDDAYLALGTQGTGSRELQELVSLWTTLSEERQQRVAEFVRDQAELSRVEFAAEMATMRREEEGELEGGQTR